MEPTHPDAKSFSPTGTTSNPADQTRAAAADAATHPAPPTGHPSEAPVTGPGGIPAGQHQSTPPSTPHNPPALLDQPFVPSWNPADNPPNQTKVSVKHEVPNQRSDPNDGRLPANPKDLPKPVNAGQVKNDPAYGGPITPTPAHAETQPSSFGTKTTEPEKYGTKPDTTK